MRNDLGGMALLAIVHRGWAPVLFRAAHTLSAFVILRFPRGS